MGFRLSFYNIPKTLADKVQTVKSDEELYSYEDDLKNEEMLYDTAYSLMSTFLNEDEKYISRLFNANLNIEEDCFYGKMNKEQFKNLIELAVRDVMDTEKKFKEKYKDEEKVKEELVRSYRYKLDTLNYVFETRIADEYKWRICYPYTWIEEIANYLFIYKTFDWENNVIFVYGG